MTAKPNLESYCIESDLREKITSSRYMAGQVRRYHTWPTLRTQTVAEHCWRVTCIYLELFGLRSRNSVVYYCLHHDSGELYTGDIPFGAKSKVPGMRSAVDEGERAGLERMGIVLPELLPDERLKVKLCDLLEMWEFGSVEMRMGNMLAQPVVWDTKDAALGIAYKLFMYSEIEIWMERNKWT